jgi:hypothetical protein
MGALFGSTPDIPKPSLPPQPKVDDSSAVNAAQAERLRRMKAKGKQQSIFAGDLSSSPVLLSTKLGGGT